MKKICVCGHFGGNEVFLDGQTIKTKNIYKVLATKYGIENIDMLDTFYWKKNPIKFLCKSIKKFKNSKNIVMLPSQNGVKVFVPLFLFLNRFMQRKIFYIVLGGWLPQMLNAKKWLAKRIKKMNKVFVETKKMKNRLNNMGINNIEILLNFKDIVPLKESEIIYNIQKPLKLCTLCLLVEKKGIEDAINVINRINEDANDTIYELDIYGQIDNSYKERFEQIMREFPEYINYKGSIESNKTVDVIKNYYLLLFPTRFKTEGIPGTIIDAFSSATPVVASNWDNCKEIIENNKTGYIYDFEDIEQFYSILKELFIKPYELKIKQNCLKESEKYNPEKAIEVLTKYII